MASSQKPRQVESDGYIYKEQAIRGPTWVHVCAVCGHRLGLWKLDNGNRYYHCDHCDDDWSDMKFPFNVNRHEVAMWTAQDG